MSLARNVLRATEVDVDCITMHLDCLGGRQELVGVIRAKLHNQRAVARPALLAMDCIKRLISVSFVATLGE